MTATLVSRMLTRLRWLSSLKGNMRLALLFPARAFRFKSLKSSDINDRLSPEQIALSPISSMTSIEMFNISICL